MTIQQNVDDDLFGRITDAKQLGAVIRSARKSQHLTLEKVSRLTNVSMRFLSELAPFYDLVCTRAIERIDNKLAMSVGKEFNPELVTIDIVGKGVQHT